MGRIATAPLSALRPTQDYLDLKTVSRYERLITSGLDAVIPVRESLYDGYEILDGHHAAVALYNLGRSEARIWIAEHPRDAPSAQDLEGTVQAVKLDDVSDQIRRRHMAGFGYVPIVNGREATQLSDLL